MRPLSSRRRAPLGVVLLALGAFVLVRGVGYASRRDVVKVGDLKASVDEQHVVPPWVGGGALVAGLGLVLAGVSKWG